MRRRSSKTRRPFGAVWFAPLVFSLVVPGVSLHGQSRELHQGLARQLVRQALAQQEEGDAGTARFLLERARRVAPDLGDAFYHLAMLQDAGRDDRHYRQTLLLQALQLPLESLEFERVAAAYAELLMETGRSGEAIPFLTPHQGDPAIDTLLTEALLNAGPAWSAGDSLSRRRAADPLNVTLGLLDYRRFPVVTISQLEWIQEMLSGDAENAPDEILSHVITALPSDAAEVRMVLTELYLDRGGTALEPVLLRVIDAEVPIDPRLAEALAEDGKSLWELLARRVGYADWPQNLPAPFEPALDLLERGEHALYRDDLSDHSWEEYRLADGNLVQWRHDAGRDGTVERSVQFGGSALTVRLRDGDEIFQLRYSRYPLLSEVHRYQVTTTEEREEIDRLESRRWRPVQPLPYEINLAVVPVSPGGLAVPFSNDPQRRFFTTVEMLPGRVMFESEMTERFQRQLAGAEAYLPDAASVAQLQRELRELEMLR